MEVKHKFYVFERYDEWGLGYDILVVVVSHGEPRPFEEEFADKLTISNTATK